MKHDLCDVLTSFSLSICNEWLIIKDICILELGMKSEKRKRFILYCSRPLMCFVGLDEPVGTNCINWLNRRCVSVDRIWCKHECWEFELWKLKFSKLLAFKRLKKFKIGYAENNCFSWGILEPEECYYEMGLMSIPERSDVLEELTVVAEVFDLAGFEKAFESLKSITIICQRAPDKNHTKHVAHILSCFKSLKEIHLRCKVDKQVMTTTAIHARRLKALSIEPYICEIDQEDVIGLLRNCSQLQSFHCAMYLHQKHSGGPQFEDAVAESVGSTLTSLSVVGLLGPPAEFNRVLHRFPQLTSLSLTAAKDHHHCYPTMKSTFTPEVAQSLRCIAVTDQRIDPFLLQCWAEYCTSLTELNLSSCDVKDAQVLPILAKNKSLQVIKLAACPITDVALLEVRCSCYWLQTLDISACRAITAFMVLKLLRKMNHLRHLTARDCPCIREVLSEDIIVGKRLRLLDIRECRGLVEKDLDAMQKRVGRKVVIEHDLSTERKKRLQYAKYAVIAAIVLPLMVVALLLLMHCYTYVYGAALQRVEHSALLTCIVGVLIFAAQSALMIKVTQWFGSLAVHVAARVHLYFK